MRNNFKIGDGVQFLDLSREEWKELHPTRHDFEFDDLYNRYMNKFNSSTGVIIEIKSDDSKIKYPIKMRIDNSLQTIHVSEYEIKHKNRKQKLHKK